MVFLPFKSHTEYFLRIAEISTNDNIAYSQIGEESKIQLKGL